VREVFTTDNLKELAGSMSVGHVRYPTVGANSEHDVQPFRVDFPVGIAMAHNGNVTNFQELKHRWFPERHIRLTSDCDLEAVLYVFAAKLQHKAGSGVAPEDIRDAVAEVFETVKGAYSVVGIVAEQGMFAFRDPFGIKPIVLGRKETEEGVSFAVASESVVLDLAGYERVRDLAAGEALWIDNDYKLTRARSSPRSPIAPASSNTSTSPARTRCSTTSRSTRPASRRAGASPRSGSQDGPHARRRDPGPGESARTAAQSDGRRRWTSRTARASSRTATSAAPSS
jgi:amidophosphoribosyltransferase